MIQDIIVYAILFGAVVYICYEVVNSIRIRICSENSDSCSKHCYSSSSCKDLKSYSTYRGFYKRCVRPIFFIFNPELSHTILMKMLRVLRYVPFGYSLIRYFFGVKRDDSKEAISLMGITFKNRVGLAAGFDKNGDNIDLLSRLGFGFIEVGTVTPKSQDGNPKQRIFRLKKDSSIVNRMGMNNKGVEHLKNNLIKKKIKCGNTIIGVSIGKNTTTDNADSTKEYLFCLKELYDYADYFIVNISCPNVVGLSKLQGDSALKEMLESLTGFVNSQKKRKPLLLKISPDLTTEALTDVIKNVVLYKIDGITLINTTTRRDVLKNSSETEVVKIGAGGLSGKALNSLLLENLEKSMQIKKELGITDTSFTTIAVGGIMSSKDAMMAKKRGAELFQIYSGFIYEGPSLISRLRNYFLIKNV